MKFLPSSVEFLPFDAAPPRPLLAALALLLSVGALIPAAEAEVIFGDSMNYPNNANMRLVWLRSGTSGGQATFTTTFTGSTNTTTRTPASSPQMSLNNGLVFADLPSNVQDDFTLRFKMLNTSYSRISHLAIMDVTGRFGYGVHWDAQTPTTSGGMGSVSLTRLSFGSTWVGTGTNYLTSGTKLTTATSNHPATGYQVTGTSPVTYSSSFQDFATFELAWTKATGVFTLKQDGFVILTFTDTTYKNFKRLYFAGNQTSFLDEVLLSSGTSPTESRGYGAQMPFVTLEAEDYAGTMKGALINGGKASWSAAPITPLQEASGRSFVQLNQVGDYVEFPNVPEANALVIRHCIPDAPTGGGITATLGLYVNGARRQSITLSSKYNWLYSGTAVLSDNGQQNNPTVFATAYPHVYWDETRLFITGGVQKGDTIRLQKDAQDTAAYYRIDLIEPELAPDPLPQPADSISIATFGGNGADAIDDTVAFNNGVSIARIQNKVLWIPPGKYLFGSSGTLQPLNGAKVQGAGIWYTELYHTATNSSTFRIFAMSGTNASVSDLYIDSHTQTNRGQYVCWPFSSTGTGWKIRNCWITHTGVGAWMAGFNGEISNCRIRLVYADGININNGNVLESNVVLVENNHIRGNGDDGIAILDQEKRDESTGQIVNGPTNNVTARNNTVVAQWWGLNGDLAGGVGHLVENNYFADGAGFGLNMPNAFPMRPLVNSIVRRNIILRAGRNHSGQKRGAIWTLPSTDVIQNLVFEENVIVDPIYRGVHFAGNFSQQIVFKGTLIDSPGENAVFAAGGSVGTVTFDTTAIRNSGTFAQFQNSSGGSLTIVQQNTLPYQQWKFDKFSTSDFKNLETIGTLADPDGDGRPNLGEYGLNTQPKILDSTTDEPTPRVENDHLVLTYFRPTGRTDLEYDVEWSDDMLNWQADAPTRVETTGNAAVSGGTLITVRTVASVSELPRQYLRLRIRKL